MRRKRTQAAGKRPKAAGLGAPAQVAGIPTSLIVVGVLAAAGIAYLSSGSGDTETPADGGDGTAPTNANAGTGTSSGSTLPKPTTTPAGTPKKARPAITKALPENLYVFVNSIGGEGIFDRLRTSFNVLHAVDGYGIDRIATLSNGEFLGYATGKEWTSTESGRVYRQLWYSINGKQYNYWVEKSETKAMHSNGVAAAKAAGYQWSGTSAWRIEEMSAATKTNIVSFYANNYL